MKWSMGFAALILSLSVLFSRFMGLIRDKVISWQFGASSEADIYFTAFVIPDFINYLIAGGYISITLIPFLSEKFFSNNTLDTNISSHENEKDAWDFFSTVFTWFALAISFFCLIAFIFAHKLAPLIAPGFDPEQIKTLSYYLRIILFAQVFFILGACLSAILYIRKQFTVPALIPLIYNGFILLLGIAFPYFGIADNMSGFCYGVLIGAFIGAFLLPFYAVAKNGLTLKFMLKHKDFKKFIFLALPLMLGQSIVILDEQFIRIFGSMAGEGAVSLLNYARRIMLVPVGVVAQAAALASFPFLSALLAQKKYDDFNETLLRALHSSLIFIIPVTLFMILQSENILGIIFEGGHFSNEETKLAAPLLQIMLISVPFWAIQQIVGRAFYAYKDTITPAIIGTIATIVCVPLYIYFVPLYGAITIASMTSISLFCYTALLLIVWQKKKDFSLTASICIVCLRSISIAIIPLLLAFYIPNYTLQNYVFSDIYMMKWVYFIYSGFIFSLFWLAFCFVFNKKDLMLIAKPILNKIIKRKKIL